MTTPIGWMMHAPALRSLMSARAGARRGARGAPEASSPRRPQGVDSEFERRFYFPGRPGSWRSGEVAVLEVRGAIFPHRSAFWDELMAAAYGGTMLDDLATELARLAADPEVKGILLSIDSPGGMADGVAEAAAGIRELARSTPIHAHTSGSMCSAAYYLGCAALSCSAAPGSMVGAIGTIVAFLDDRELLESMGLKEVVFKSSVSPDKWPDPLTAEGAALYQQSVDANGRQFVRDVARYRGVTEAKVKAAFGRGWVVDPGPAREAGMIDAVETLDRAIDRLASAVSGGGTKSGGGRRAASLGPRPASAGVAASLGGPAGA